MAYTPPIHKGFRDPTTRMLSEVNAYNHLRIVKIVRVDNEKLTVDVIFLDSMGSEINVPITSAYAGYRAFLGGLPSPGDFAIISYTKSGNLYNPFIVQFLPQAYQLGLANDIIDDENSLTDYGEKNLIRHKMQKLYEGEIYASSKYGSEIYLDKGISISNSRLNEILLRSADQSYNINALNGYLNYCGIRSISGLIHRNALINDPEFQSLGDSLFPVYYNDEGLPYYTVPYTSTINASSPYGSQTINDNLQGFVEHRTEVKEVEYPQMAITESNSGVDIDSLYSLRSDGKESNRPLVVQVLGTLVGNDPIGDAGKKKYGKILKPVLFKDNVNLIGSDIKEEACLTDNGINEATTLASAYALKFPNSGTAFYVNKQGKYFANIGASTSSDPAGSGESVEYNTMGHAKLYFGSNQRFNRSLTIGTNGGVKTVFGSENDKLRSWEATFKKGVYWNILSGDKNNLAMFNKISGDVRHEITGSRYTVITGNDIRLVHGTLEDRVFGKKVDNFVNDKSTNYGGAYTETSVGHFSQTLASGQSKTIASPDIAAGSTVAEKTEVLLGDVEHSMLLGNKTESIKVGNFDTKMIAGNRTLDIKIGNYTVKVGVGNIEIKTTLGSIDVKTSTGNVTITGTDRKSVV